MRFSKIPLVLLVSLFVIQCAGQQHQQSSYGILLEQKNEPQENAFSILVPKNWMIDGGIYRVNAATAGGPLNAIEAKCDLTLKSDDKGNISFRILPDIVYGHLGIGGGFFPAGSNYQGAMVRPIEDAPTTMIPTCFRIERILSVRRLESGEMNRNNH